MTRDARGRQASWQGGSKRPSWRERIGVLRHIPAFLKLVWISHRGYTVVVIVLRVARSVIPVVTLWIGKLIIDEVIASTGSGQGGDRLWLLVGIEILVVCLGELLSRGSAIAESLLGDRFTNEISVKMIDHAATLDLAQFENPTVHDHIERARVQTSERIGLLTQLLSIGQDALTIASLGVALIAYNPFLGGLLMIAVLPGFVGESHFTALEYSLLYRFTPQRRQLSYLRYIGTSEKTAKEVRSYGFASWLSDRYRALADHFYVENGRLTFRRGITGWVLSLFGTGGYYTAYVVLLLAATSGAISIGQLVFLSGSFARGKDTVQRTLLTATEILRHSLYLRDLFAFFEVRGVMVSPRPGIRLPSRFREGFVFENVAFRYPGHEEWALRDLNFEIRLGRQVALVGRNGAGKSTIVKLLARLYDPTEGRILLNGTDLRDYDIKSLRETIGAIFQDFVHYHMRFAENVGVGRIDAVGEYLCASDKPNGSSQAVIPRLLRGAADRSLASSLVSKWPDGYHQMLGRYFDGGVELSGGEWQKVALARGFLRDARTIILDEPTAALDPETEQLILRNLSELTRDRMSVLISHRLSTVRAADWIVVLESGRPVEQGTHADLLAQGGLYGDLFALQAAGYAPTEAHA